MVAIGVHDNMRCHGLHLHLFPDASGVVFAEYYDVKTTDNDYKRLKRTVMTMKDTEMFGFDSLEELHGELVARTMTVGGSGR